MVKEPTDDGLALTAGGWGLACILVIGETALAADVITGTILKHLKQRLAVRVLPKEAWI